MDKFDLLDKIIEEYIKNLRDTSCLSKLAINGLTQLVAAEINVDIKINAVDPGWVSTDMGGPSAPRTPKQTAESILWLATILPEGPNGGFFRDGKRIDW